MVCLLFDYPQPTTKHCKTILIGVHNCLKGQNGHGSCDCFFLVSFCIFSSLFFSLFKTCVGEWMGEWVTGLRQGISVASRNWWRWKIVFEGKIKFVFLQVICFLLHYSLDRCTNASFISTQDAIPLAIWQLREALPEAQWSNAIESMTGVALLANVTKRTTHPLWIWAIYVKFQILLLYLGSGCFWSKNVK